MVSNLERGHILLTVVDGEFTLMIVDDEGFETMVFDNYFQALEAKEAWSVFIYED
jgi:hypothetical protein